MGNFAMAVSALVFAMSCGGSSSGSSATGSSSGGSATEPVNSQALGDSTTAQVLATLAPQEVSRKALAELATAHGKGVTMPNTAQHFMVALTAPLPSVWPCATGCEPYVWVYGRAMGVGLSDGEFVSAPWAKFRFLSDGSAVLELINATPVSLGIQGVHPVARPAKTLPEAWDELVALWRAGTTAVPSELAAVLCSWASGNGVISSAMVGAPASMLASLACS